MNITESKGQFINLGLTRIYSIYMQYWVFHNKNHIEYDSCVVHIPCVRHVLVLNIQGEYSPNSHVSVGNNRLQTSKYNNIRER